jgi:hypothetical protein
MTFGKIRGLGAGLLAGACAGLLDVAALLNAAPALADAPADPVDYTALVLGHAFLSQPDATYMQEVIDTYVDPTPPYSMGEPAYNIVGNPVSVYTPETDYGSGLTQGVADLNAAIEQQLTANPDANLVVAGYSMSNSVITQEMINLAAAGAPDTDGLKFVLAEDLNNPDGGTFTRFPGMSGANLLPATPIDTPYDTTIYTIEYSGAADFPQYYGNMYADLNSADAYVDLHPYLLPGYPAYFDPSTVANAVAENTSTTTGNTDYFLIPTQDLPILDGLRDAPGAPSAFADLMQPDMRVLVDLGYNWTGDADVATPATMSNPDIDFTAVNSYLDAGADQGMIAYLVDLGVLPQPDLEGLSDLYPYVPDVLALQSGALTDNVGAANDASMSLALLTGDLAGSTNPIAVDFGSYFPTMATDLADYFQSIASSL